MPCPLLVPLVEEGWIDHHVTREVVRIYLAEALASNPAITTLLLGCTHYPLLRPIFAETLRTSAARSASSTPPKPPPKP